MLLTNEEIIAMLEESGVGLSESKDPEERGFCPPISEDESTSDSADEPASGRIFDLYDKAIAVMDIDNDTILDCLWARRENYDPEHKSVVFVWSTAVTMEVEDTVKYTVDIDGGEKSGVARYPYTDYESCTIMEVSNFGDECTLWVTDRVKDAVPEHCMIQFADICGNGVSLHDADKCLDVDI
ncbi:hypothetical protein MTO96_029282 [Rhipicephalus appendiculatus]